MSRRVLAVAIVVVGALAGVLAWRPWSKPDHQRILLSGNIEMTEVDIAFKVPGKLVERNFDEGDSVTKGAVVARLDRDQLVHQRAQVVAAIASAEAQTAQARTAVQFARESMQADIAQRTADLGATEARLLELRNGSRPEEIREAAAAVESAVAEMERASADFVRAETLLKTDDISKQAFDQAWQRKVAAEAQVKAARERAALVRQGPRSEQVEQAASEVERARAAVRASHATGIDIRRREQDVTGRRADVVRLKAQLAQIDVQLEDLVATSPVDGVVLVKAADPGEVLAAGTTVVTVGDVEHPWVRAYLAERDLGRVRLGMPVKVRTDSFPGRSFEGKLTFIASEAEFTPRQIQTQEERVKLVYRVKVEVENKGRELKSNMPVDAEIALP